MVKFRRDIDGCGCVRCQEVDPDLVKRPLSEALLWSLKLPVERPSIILIFLGIGFTQFVLLGGPDEWLVPGAVLGVLGAFIGRGYVAVTGRNVLGSRRSDSVEAVETVARRLPSFIGAFLIISLLLAALVLVTRQVLADLIRTGLQSIGVSPVVVDSLLLLALAAAILYVLIKFCFVPEACFAGGYGSLASLRVSWTITTLHRTKAAAIVGGFAALLSVGILLDTGLTGAESPVMLSFRYSGTRIILRSYGLSTTSGFRTLFDLFMATIYSGVFVHQYVSGVLER